MWYEKIISSKQILLYDNNWVDHQNRAEPRFLIVDWSVKLSILTLRMCIRVLIADFDVCRKSRKTNDSFVLIKCGSIYSLTIMSLFVRILI